MKTFKSDENNDFSICKESNLIVASDKEAVESLCKHYALANHGEMIHQMSKGVPYFKTVFGAQSNIFQFEAAFRFRMREINGVQSVDSFNAQLTDGVLKYQATIKTIYGEVQINNANL